MPTSKLGVFASLALAASAVLIPSTMSVGDLGDDSTGLMPVTDARKQTLYIGCPGCRVAVRDRDTLKWENNAAGNAFLVEFALGPRQDTLEIDGVQVYPPSFDHLAHTPYAAQFDATGGEPLRLRMTGYHFQYHGAETVSEEGYELVPMTFRLDSLEGTPVELPEVTVMVLKSADGQLHIARFESEDAVSTRPVHEGKGCDDWPLFCEWKSIIGDRVDKLKKMGKGCHKQPHGHGRPNPMEHEGIEGKPPHRFRPGRPHHNPHHRPGHHEGHRHHGPHRFLIVIRRAFFTILIPILLGIFAGTLTYLIGMALGCLIAITFAKIRGQSFQRIALDEEEEEDVEAPKVLGEKEEYAELPAYDAPPVYEEAVEKEVHEETK